MTRPTPDGDSAEKRRCKNLQDYLCINQHYPKNERKQTEDKFARNTERLLDV